MNQPPACHNRNPRTRGNRIAIVGVLTSLLTAAAFTGSARAQAGAPAAAAPTPTHIAVIDFRKALLHDG